MMPLNVGETGLTLTDEVKRLNGATEKLSERAIERPLNQKNAIQESVTRVDPRKDIAGSEVRTFYSKSNGSFESEERPSVYSDAEVNSPLRQSS